MYKRLKDLREDNDYKQSDIAKILNMTQQQYSKIKLHLFYNVSVDYLLGLTNEKNN